MSKNNYKFNILHEVVASDDQFPDKTHEKVADTLFELIESSDKGVTIGLEGGWGSGKSTVVNFIRGKLANGSSSTLVYLFDAWAHDGDPLRRIFLEGIIDEIDPEGKDEDLQKLLGEISGRKKLVEVTTRKSTSRLGGWISLSAIFVPVGAAILSTINYNNLHWFSSTRDIHIPFWIGLGLALLPFLTLLVWRIFGDEPDNDASKKSGLIKGNKKWDLFGSDVTEDYTQNITEDGERTSIEFEKYFKKIMAHSIGEGKKYDRALIVVDNLDRVEPEQTLAIWSILQTFFQHRSNYSSSEESWSSKLWFLMPFDREGLSQVWSRSNQSITSSSEQESIEGLGRPEIQNTNLSDLATSFLEKRFQLIDEVPEPVMSAWVEYCEKCIRQALVDWPENELVEVIDTFKRFESRLDSSPTPRQIHTFTNRVGLLGMRWGGEMNAEAIALYALLRKNRSDRQLRKELLLGDLPTGYEGERSSEVLKRQLAGMLFGVNENKGIQLLLEPEIRSALNGGDPDPIQALIKEHKEAFWVTWKSIGASYMPNGHVEEHRIAVTVAFCKGILGYESRASADILRLVSEWKKQDHKWKLDEYDYSEALSSLISIVKDSAELVEWLSNKVLMQLKDVVDEIGDESFNSRKLTNISKLSNLLEIYECPVAQARYDALDYGKWVTLLEALKTEEIEMPYLLPSKNAVEALLSQVDISNPSPLIISTIKTTLDISPKDEIWNMVTDKVVQWGQNPNRVVGCNSGYDILLYLYSIGEKSIRGKIRKCVNHPDFISRVEHENIDLTPALAVLCASVHRHELHSSSLGPIVKDFWQCDFDQKKHKPVVDLMREYEELQLVWDLARKPGNNLAIGIIRSESSSISGSIYSSELGAMYIDEYDWATEEEIPGIISKLVEFGGLKEAESTLIDDPVGCRECLLLIHQHGGGYRCQHIN